MTRRALCGRLFENWKVPKALAEAGYDVVWVGDWPKDPGDEEGRTAR